MLGDSVGTGPAGSSEIWTKVLQGEKLEKPDLVALGRAVKDETKAGRFLFAITPRFFDSTNDKILKRIAVSWLKQQNYGVAEHILGLSSKKTIKEGLKALEVNPKAQLLNFSPPDLAIIPDSQEIAEAIACDLEKKEAKAEEAFKRVEKAPAKPEEAPKKLEKAPKPEPKPLSLDKGRSFKSRISDQYTIRTSVGDGNCLFDSCLEGNKRKPQELRQQTYAYMRANRSAFEGDVRTLLMDDLLTLTDSSVSAFEKQRLMAGVTPQIANIYENLTAVHAQDQETYDIMLESWLYGDAFDDYCNAMSSSKGYGTLVEIRALSESSERPIRVYSPIYESQEGVGYIDVPIGAAFDPNTTLCLLYHADYKHYERLYPKN